MNWPVTLKNKNNDSSWHSCAYTRIFNSTNQHIRPSKPAWLHILFTSSTQAASTSSGAISGMRWGGWSSTSRATAAGGNLWHTGNATNYFLGKKKSLCFPLFSSAGSSRTLTTSDCQLQGTLSTGKLLCILYGWRCIFFCYSIHYVFLFVLR